MSLPEVKLWEQLRKRPGGFKFRRQHPAGDYVLDFFCAAARLAIEVDGFAHDSEITVSRDRYRSDWLRSQGLAITRIPARLILDDVEPVLRRLVEICQARKDQTARRRPVPLHQPSAGPPPRAGED
jgi:very-short-patch-repair endonuclease